MPRTMHHAAVSRSVSRTSGLTFFGKPVTRFQHRQLTGQVLDVPVQRVAEQHGGLVVEVVAGDQHGVAAVDCGLVEEVSLAHPARRTRNPTGGLRRGRNVVAVLVAQLDLDQAQTSLGRERTGVLGRHVAVVADPQSDVETVGVVPEVDQQVPHREAVLASGDRDQEPVLSSEHLEMVDRLGDLSSTQLQEVLGTEVGVVTRQVDDRRAATGATLRSHRHHHAPPEITGRISTVSLSSSSASPGTSVPLQITR